MMESSHDDEEQLINIYQLRLVLQNKTQIPTEIIPEVRPEIAPHAYSP
jgi:hypothetical protein